MSDYMPTTEEIVEAVVYHQTRKGFDGMGTVGREEAVSRVSNWLAQERAQARREAVVEFAKQHGIGDLESRPLYDAQQYIADLESEVGWLRRENRRLAEQAATAEADTLRKAAEAIDLSDGRHRQDCPPHMFHHERVAETWLRDRAAKLERK